MANSVVITGPTFTNKIGTGLPAVPGLQSLEFWGTGFDANNNNRVPGGPALSVLNGTPVYASNYVSLGLQSAVNTAIDSNVVMTPAVLSSGWTWLSAFRGGTSGSGILVGTQESGGTGVAMQLGFAASTKTIQVFSAGAHAQVVLAQPLSNWHIVALTYSGGAANGLVTVYELTENAAPATYTVPTATSGTTSFHYGCSSTENFATAPADQACSLVATQPLIQADLITLAASIRSFLARRGISA